MERAQMLKGILEGCLLKIIAHKPVYSYELAMMLKQYGFIDITEGTIYPLMLRLEKSGVLSCYMEKSVAGPRRKYYQLTEKGKQELCLFLKEWEQLKTNVDLLIKGEMQDEVSVE